MRSWRASSFGGSLQGRRLKKKVKGWSNRLDVSVSLPPSCVTCGARLYWTKPKELIGIPTRCEASKPESFFFLGACIRKNRTRFARSIARTQIDLASVESNDCNRSHFSPISPIQKPDPAHDDHQLFKPIFCPRSTRRDFVDYCHQRPAPSRSVEETTSRRDHKQLR